MNSLLLDIKSNENSPKVKIQTDRLSYQQLLHSMAEQTKCKVNAKQK